MDAKDLRTESALSERNNDGSKYSQSGGIALHCDRNKSYQDIGSNSLGKVDLQNARPCAVIGPDRVVPPSAPNEAYLKKGPAEQWPCIDNAYHTRRPPEYPHKLANFQNPTRNISPRQTFQENMQRIMVPPSYNSVKISDDTNYVQITDRSNALPKNIKINVPPEAKFCDVPYTVYQTNNEQKNVRNAEMCISSVNPTLTRTVPHGWPAGSVNIRPTRTYGAPELYQYQEYPSCAGPRPVVPRPNRTVPEDQGYVYADPFYHQEGNIRFKPYPTVKDRFPQQRYEYIGNYANSFHPPPAFPAHKYELQKNVPPHPYPPYPPVKYIDRVPEPVMEGYQRNQQGGYNIPYRNQIIHPNYGPVLGNCPQNKIHSYPSDAHIKTLGPNKIPFDNAKAYVEYENGRPKMYPPSESYLVNEMGRVHPMKSQVIMPNYSTINMHNIPPNPYYKKDNQQIKNYEYLQAHFRSMDPNLNIHNPMIRHPSVFSPNTSAISPTDSSTSNDTSQTLGSSQEDCGYVSQSSTASARSMDSGINRITNDCLRKYYDSRYGPIIRTAPMMSKSELNSNNNSKEKKNIDVRQFLQMWNEGDEEAEENHSKEIIIQSGPKSENNFIKTHEVISQPNQEQLYVLGLVNVPSEELGKYEHIQKVSKLPENIKGYNHIELLNQFEEAIESSNMNYKTSTTKDYQVPPKVVPSKLTTGIVPPRPISPLDVEAKISQSVIHKEVGCNFEIKPCSPKMLNVEVATPVQNILAERAIEKVANPVMLKSPRLNGLDENIDCNIMKRKENRVNINNEPVRIPSCKMVNTQFSNNSSIDSIKNSYSLQDLESNSGLCLASLPRLDNDIELNFPEVNQQFINANKGDSSVSTSLGDLPSLELIDQSDNQTKDKLNNINLSTQVNDVLKSPCIIDSEKEFSKLSKYRKTKTHSLDSKENQAQVTSALNAARTDSVIIKNPENAKNYEDKNTVSPNCLNKTLSDTILQVPINLTSQGSNTENVSTNATNIEPHGMHSKESDKPIEIAIDFSLNKNSSNENSEAKDIKDSDILTNTTIEENNSILDEHFSKLPIFSDCDHAIQNPFIGNNKMYENATSPIGYSESEAVPQAKKDDDNLASIENPPLEDIFLENKSLMPVPGDKEVKEAVDSSSSDSGNSLPLEPIEFAKPSTELSQTDSSSSNCLMDIDNHNDTLDIHLQKSNINLTDNDLGDSDLKSDSSLNDDEALNNITTNIKNKNCVEDENIKMIVDSELDSEVAKDNVSQVDKPTMVEDTQKSNATNFDLTNEDLFDNNAFHLKNRKEDTNCNFGLTSHNIVTNSTDNYEPETDDPKIETYLPSTNNLVTHISNGCQSKIAECDPDLSSESNLSVALLSPKSSLSEPAEQKPESNFHLLSLNDTVENIGKDDQSERTNPDAEFKSICPNNINIATPQNYGSDVTDLQTLTASNCSKVNQLDTHSQKPVSDFDLHSKEDIGANKTTDVVSDPNVNTISLTEKVPHNRTESVINKEMSNKDIFVDNVEKTCDTHSIINLQKEEGNKHKHLGIRYLSFGSKEMYSPWIQKLVLFCEGYTKNVYKQHDQFSDSDRELIENTEDAICKPLDLDHIPIKNVDAKSNSESHSKTSSDDNNTSEQLVQIEVPVEKEYFKTNLNNIYEQDFETTEDVDDQCNNESNFLQDANICQEEISLKPSIESTKPPAQDNISETSTECSLANDIDILPNFEGDKPCLSSEELEQWESRSESSDKSQEKWDNYDNYNNEINERWDAQFNCSVGIPELLHKQPPQTNFAPNQIDKKIDSEEQQSNSDDNLSTHSTSQHEAVSDKCNKESNSLDEITDQLCNDVTEPWNKQSDCVNLPDNKLLDSWEELPNSEEESSHLDTEQQDKGSKINEEIFMETDRQANCDVTKTDSSTIVDNDKLTCPKGHSNEHQFFNKRRQPLKRSLSDSALNVYHDNNEHSKQENEENLQFVWPFKRRKMIHNGILAQDLCSIIQNNRRNSISAIYNEENVSFCILIDDGCIITEEENDGQDKICFTELPEECLAELQNECSKDEENIETMTEAMSDISVEQPENICEYSDSFIMQDENEKLDESWVEDVACVETVISDDIAEDIEISAPMSPKDDTQSDNDESGVFSSSEHTDKVKYIYGDKMCNDDAQFVETLYNTPQMNVNKTLIERGTVISGEYYDNDSLEKILSESNDQHLSPYVPEYIEPVYSPRFVDVQETAENKGNMEVQMISPLQSNVNTVDVVDTGLDKIHEENVKLCEFFDETQDDTVHSCESSMDNVFTYNETEENTNYTSSSPEVSSTTSEEKKSAILLKITSYQGSRISHINDINRDNKRPSCKFTEDKDYVQSHSNFSTHRPLLTKAAQKYIPPLKESMRDLKVKLSLPQHSLMKLKQLKKSKDEPKVCKQNVTIPRISKKPKPKFEDVLKSIDEIQIKMHKEKTKKSKKSIPKVVIKKNVNGSHYASTSNKEEFNPDLTGRKWQPWVFIEKNHFIDKMAMKKKTKAIYSHRKRTYVLAEKFQKYKSVNSGKFVISPPISDCPSAGLKYTIRLKHNY